MTIKSNPDNQPKAETLTQLVQHWENSLERLADEDDVTVAGYIAADIMNTKFWEDEWMESEEADPDVIEVHDLALALEVPGQTVVSPEEDTPISREQAWEHVKDRVRHLHEKYAYGDA